MHLLCFFLSKKSHNLGTFIVLNFLARKFGRVNFLTNLKSVCGGTRYEGSVVNIFSLKHGDRDRGRVLKTPPFYLSLSLFLSPNIRVSLAAKITNLDILQTSKRID